MPVCPNRQAFCLYFIDGCSWQGVGSLETDKSLVMKCKTIVSIAIICFLAIGCKSKIAKDYNDMIVERQKSLGKSMDQAAPLLKSCLLYTSDAADERSSVDLGGRRII